MEGRELYCERLVWMSSRIKAIRILAQCDTLVRLSFLSFVDASLLIAGKGFMG